MKRQRGVTLIEIMIVIAIISILAAIGFMSFQRYTWRSELRQAQSLLLNSINQARSDTRLKSVDTFVQWTETSVGVGDDLDTIVMKNLDDNGNVTITDVEGSAVDNFFYVAPNGQRNSGNSIVFTLQGRGDLQGIVKVIGVTGKAFVE
jgi:prepilin-type N-terminal cleavage/methylation domain-containing protein